MSQQCWNGSVTTAHRQPVALKQGKGEFATYCSQFFRIVAYLNYNEGVKIDALADGLSEGLKNAMTYRTDRLNMVEAYATMLMTIDKQIRGRKAERAIHNTMGQFIAPAATAHLSHTAGYLAPIDFSTFQAHPTQQPATEQRYTFVNGQRKIISKLNKLCKVSPVSPEN
ncbi:hypothetical protein P167DRAFT_580318 [Morchella conica CCBAS932]|uniref:Retrotransposon gag domain-containing protein n=1 Tax=Morchella conica CCBAS932 TaxID=1392247 RepID=A0A3N4K7T4_9PEZI|nr:hypothetical protein P167DRAFT_580318 [Morchella conica CCBAS932]